MKFLLIYRDERFSPNAVERDKAVLDEVARQTVASHAGADIRFLHEHELQDADAADYAGFTVVHMARSAEALAKLEEMQALGTRVLNPPMAIRAVRRENIEKVMMSLDMPTPAVLMEQHPELGGKGWWIKANDTTDSTPSHIQFAETLPAEVAMESKANGRKYLVQPNIEGREIKFYGVKDADFFKVREDIPADVFQLLKASANALALDIYGGDAILTDGGLLTIIDFNDFPSFSSCMEEAAEAIVKCGIQH